MKIIEKRKFIYSLGQLVGAQAVVEIDGVQYRIVCKLSFSGHSFIYRVCHKDDPYELAIISGNADDIASAFLEAIHVCTSEMGKHTLRSAA